MMRILFLLLLTASLLLSSCENLASVTLLAGILYKSPPYMEAIDGDGSSAQFGEIKRLQIDTVGNLYVLDFGSESHIYRLKNLPSLATLRRVKLNGLVETILDKFDEKSLIASDITIRNDILYVASAGCLLKADLNQEQLFFQAFYGKCIDLEQIKILQQEIELSNAVIPIEQVFLTSSFTSIRPEQNLFIGVGSVDSKQSTYLKLDPNENISIYESSNLLPPLFSDFFAVMNSQGEIYDIFEGVPGPGAPGKNHIVQANSFESLQQENFKTEVVYEDILEDPRSLTFDNQDYLYVRDKDVLKRISPNGKVLRLSQIKSTEDLNTNAVVDQVINSQRTWLYFATETSIYKIPLPPTTKP